ncbi:MAG: 5-(carboxyamino)imidazole ribonucleotide mutase, partial [Desulfatiglandales bacterium]
VAVIMGSPSDRDCMLECTKVLEELKIGFEVKILSAHRTPELLYEYSRSAHERGIEVIIAGAGWAAHLAGAIAANTILPVIGVPIDSSPLKGFDSLLSTVQMPPGIPVATMAIGAGGARNAGIFAAEILALKYPEIRESLKAFRERITRDASKRADGPKGP